MLNNNIEKMQKINAVTAFGRDAVFVCFVISIVATPASELTSVSCVPGIYRVVQKNGTPVLFCDNFRKWTPILTIFSPLELRTGNL